MPKGGNPNVFAPLRGKPRGSGRIVTLDIETWGLDARPAAFALGVVYDGKRRWEFASLDEMVRFITSTYWDGATFFAHNGGRYDYLALFGNLWRYFGGDNLVIRGAKFYEAIVRHERKAGNQTLHSVIRFRDSFNLIPTSLEKIGKALGFPKGHTPDKFKNADRSAGITKEDIEYCARDCEVLWKALNTFLQEFGELRPTIPSTAMAVFRRQYLPKPIWIRRDLDKLFRQAYYGGRVECYRLGPIPHPNYYYDVNSLFPQAMVEASFPDPSTYRRMGVTTEEELKNVMERYEGFATCEIQHPPSPRGFLPHRRDDNRLLFPIGRFGGSWTFPELRAFLARGGRVLRVSLCVVGERIPSPFREYVARFYELKRHAEGFHREIAKLMLNGLYGKFGEYHETQEVYAERFDKDTFERLEKEHGGVTWAPISQAREDGYYVYQMGEQASAGHSIYAWAAYITAYARVINLRWQEAFNEKGFEVFYTDTDSFTCASSIGVAGNGPIPFDDSEDLGGLKLEKCHDETGKATHPTQLGWVGGNKFYQTCCERKLKGVKKEAEILSKDQEGRPIVFRYKAIRGLKDAIRKGAEVGAPYFIAKHIGRDYDKRRVFPDGHTEPIELAEQEQPI